jgi:hypothetical protein
MPLRPGPGAEMNVDMPVSPADAQPVAGGQGTEGASDEEVPTLVQTEVVKVDSRRQ